MKPDAQRLTSDEALTMIAEVFNEPPGSVQAGTVRGDLKGWDSMGVLMLTAELDERFGVELASDASSAMKSVTDILDFLQDKGLLRE